MNHEPDGVTVAELASRAVEDFADVEDNRVLVEEGLIERFHRAEADGLICDDVPTHRQLVDKWLLAELRRLSDNRQKQMKLRLVSGQMVLDLGADFDAVITVCSRQVLGDHATAGRITTLGLMTADDLVLMGIGSRLNRGEVDRADDDLQAANGEWVPILRQFPNYRSYRSTLAGAA